MDATREALAERMQKQLYWSEDEYIALTDAYEGRVELVENKLEVLSMPTDQHQAIIGFMFTQLQSFVGRAGVVRVAGILLRISPKTYREPDLVVLKDRNDARRQNRAWLGADVAIEVVSEKGEQRDYAEKSRDYAAAGVGEYWIIDPLDSRVTIYTLVDGGYGTPRVCEAGDEVGSLSLVGFSVKARDIFEAD